MGEAGVGVDVADDVNGVGCGAEAQHLRVKAHRHVDVVFAGQKKQRIARGAEFAVLLNRVNLVDLLLDLGRGHGGIEDQYVGAEIRASQLPLATLAVCAWTVATAMSPRRNPT